MLDYNFYKSLILETIESITSKKIDCEVDLHGDESDKVQGATILSAIQAYNGKNKKRLNLLNNALLKLKTGEYGYCEGCGELIAYKRLNVCPEAKYCIICAELKERGTR